MLNKKIGWSTFSEWTTSSEIHEIETDRGNEISDVLLEDNHSAKWVCLKKQDAVRYLREAEKMDIKEFPPIQEELDSLFKIDLTNCKQIGCDSDGGTLWIKKHIG